MVENRAIGEIIESLLGKKFGLKTTLNNLRPTDWVEIESVKPTVKGPMEVTLKTPGGEAIKLPMNVLTDAIHYGLLKEI